MPSSLGAIQTGRTKDCQFAILTAVLWRLESNVGVIAVH